MSNHDSNHLQYLSDYEDPKYKDIVNVTNANLTRDPTVMMPDLLPLGFHSLTLPLSLSLSP